jgi:hypothetical protein
MNNNEKDINLIAIKSLIECIDNRDIAEGGIFLDDDNAEFVADILRYRYKTLTTENKMEALAQLFGKKLGELFRMKWENEQGTIEYMCEFTTRGLRCYPSAKNNIKYTYSNNDWLFLLLIGEAVITNE